ncbi:protein involved in ribonucleotide reduction [Solibacillus kalamii]|nr:MULTISPECIES: class Ib ribonucleoside-diphosphate reductase assembly flavoprotein NrdI [Solibacillus]MBM7665800.1 protein involved in ribonucleotide reduction [Solibacillus kalamii]OBW55821.1 nrdI protein [Solibacillus silvestris]OUZ38757.1 class Ib ribonucleoside-diphosphate reductase assembly flavoprotein NrdI [Solibacillus kalamii]
MIIFASRTGNVRSIVQKLGLPAKDLAEVEKMDEPYLLFTYTDGLGSVPPIVDQFMTANFDLCKGIIVSGNRNFGHAFFGRAGDLLAAQYGIPLIEKVEMRGTPANYEAITDYYYSIWKEASI